MVSVSDLLVDQGEAKEAIFVFLFPNSATQANKAEIVCARL